MIIYRAFIESDLEVPKNLASLDFHARPLSA